MPSFCRSCKAPVIWARTTQGRNMPVDAEPSPTGNLVLSPGSGSGALSPRVYMLGPGDQPAEGLQRYTSHFATCKYADQHRKSR